MLTPSGLVGFREGLGFRVYLFCGDPIIDSGKHFRPDFFCGSSAPENMSVNMIGTTSSTITQTILGSMPWKDS